MYAGKTESDNIALQFGVPHTDEFLVRANHRSISRGRRGHFPKVGHHLFADETQGYCSGRLGDVPAIVSRPDSCIADIYTSVARSVIQAQRRQDRAAVVRSCIAAASAAITEQYRPHQPVCPQASDRRRPLSKT